MRLKPMLSFFLIVSLGHITIGFFFILFIPLILFSFEA